MAYKPPSRKEATARLIANARKLAPTVAAGCRTIDPASFDLSSYERDLARKRALTAPLSMPQANRALSISAPQDDADDFDADVTETPDETPPTTSTPPPRPPLPPASEPLETQPAPEPEATPAAPVPPVSTSDDQPEVARVEVVEAVSPPEPPPPLPLSRLAAHSLRPHAKAAARRIREIMVERGIPRVELLRLVRAVTPSCAPLTVETSIDHLLAGTASPRSVWYRRAANALGLALSDLCTDPLWVLSVVTEDTAYIRAAHIRRTPPTLPPNPQITAPQIEAPKDLPQIEAAPPTPPTHRPLEDLARAAQAALAHCVSLTADAEGLRAQVRDLETHNAYLRDRVASLEARLQRIAGEAKL